MKDETDVTNIELEIQHVGTSSARLFKQKKGNQSSLRFKSQNPDTESIVINAAAYEDQEMLSSLVSTDDISYPDGGWKAYSTVIASHLGLICGFGLMNSTGAIESYLETNVLTKTSASSISWIFAIFSFLAFLGNVISGALFDTFGVKSVCIPGAILLCAGMMATASSTTVWQFILSLGVCCGSGCSLLMAPLVSCVSHFFKRKRGLALGIAMPGASLGGVIWPLVCRSLYGKIGFGWTMRVIGFIFIGLLALSCYLIHDRREEINNSEAENTDIWSKLKDSIDFSALKDKTYVILVVALFLNEFSLLIGQTYIPSYALNKGFSESVSLLGLTLVNASGILGRYIPSHLSDVYGKFNLMIAMSGLTTLSVLVLWLPFGHIKAVYFVFCLAYGFGVAGTLALTPLCTSAISGPRDFGKRYGTAYFFVSFGNLISLPVGISITKTAAGYNGMVAFAGAFSAAATLFFVFARLKIAGWSVTVV